MTPDSLENLATGAIGFSALLLLKDFAVPIFRRRLQRVDAAEQEARVAVLQRLDQNQAALSERLKEDRVESAKHFGDLWALARGTEKQVIKLAAHHEQNHPGQSVGQ